MEVTTKTTSTLDNSWWTTSTSKLTNSIDIHCTILKDAGTAKISIDKPGENNPGIFYLDGQYMRADLEKVNIGYNTEYKITAITTNGATANCKIKEHTSSIPLDFMVYDLPIVLSVGFYIFLFLLGLKISFFRR